MNIQSMQRTYRMKCGWPVLRYSYERVTTLLTWTLAEGRYFFLLVDRVINATMVAAVAARNIPNWNIILIESYVTIYTPHFQGVPTVHPLHAVAFTSLSY